ncbi:hypothetical protein LCGC14_0893220 [marine sediment metagenome]|uniref:Uncharacterized protein n=1 Tax=marine sediment metagenome TaxID=412755 RepID=A0A0F9P3E1_9ZZZZ
MPRYTWRTVTLSVPTGLNRVQFFNGNSRRVSLIVSGNISTGMRVGSDPGSGPGGLYVTIESQSLRTLRFADYGPAMQSPVWVSHGSAGAVEVTVTEIVFISRCN